MPALRSNVSMYEKLETKEDYMLNILDKIKGLECEVKNVSRQNNEMRSEMNVMSEKISLLEKENINLRHRNFDLKQKNDALEKTVEELKCSCQEKDNIISSKINTEIEIKSKLTALEDKLKNRENTIKAAEEKAIQCVSVDHETPLKELEFKVADTKRAQDMKISNQTVELKAAEPKKGFKTQELIKKVTKQLIEEMLTERDAQTDQANQNKIKQLLEQAEELTKRSQESQDKTDAALKQIAELNAETKTALDKDQKLQQQMENMKKEKEMLMKRHENAEKVFKQQTENLKMERDILIKGHEFAEKVLKQGLMSDVTWPIRKRWSQKSKEKMTQFSKIAIEKNIRIIDTKVTLKK